ncbi:NRDE protein-domain-containing protein [Gloeopeniophorella convolvens]|nr:NRDE protein-domain-containing protein [Gloeopeniophorella convolvens]
MCVAFWSLDHPDYALILCANRDEYLARPTAPAHFHSFAPVVAPEPAPGTAPDSAGPVLSGRDMQAGGTWLGIARSGRVALLTNITEPAASYASTRGTLAASFLAADPRGAGLARAAAALERENAQYAGFNLLLLELAPPALRPGSGLAYDARLVTNNGGGGTICARALSDVERACGGVSNGAGDAGAAWPKVVEGTAALRALLAGVARAPADDMQLAERLLALLTMHTPNPPPRERAELKDMILVPPLDARAGPDVPPAVYGTRLAQALLVRRDGRATFVERDVWVLDEAGAAVRAGPSSQRTFAFRVGPEAAAGASEGPAERT